MAVSREKLILSSVDSSNKHVVSKGLTAHSDHNAFCTQVYTEFHASRVEVMLDGDCNKPLEEYLKMVELRRCGEDEDIGNCSVEGPIMTLRACVVIHPASQLHILLRLHCQPHKLWQRQPRVNRTTRRPQLHSAQIIVNETSRSLNRGIDSATLPS